VAVWAAECRGDVQQTLLRVTIYKRYVAPGACEPAPRLEAGESFAYTSLPVSENNDRHVLSMPAHGEK
jgi:hypothetical protein